MTVTGLVDIEDTLNLDERAAVGFVAGLRTRWAGAVYPALIDQALAVDAPAESLEQATASLHALPLYPWFSHLERAQQKMLWRVAGDAVLRQRDLLTAQLDRAAGRAGTLSLDPDLVLPGWYTETDIHCQPGAVFTDPTSAFIYELGARVVMLRDNDGFKFHRLFADTALPDLPTGARVVDVGCGFGKSTRPLVARYPGAEVIGLDLSAPVLRLAHAKAGAADLPIQYRQADAAATGLADGSVDLVTGTMILHELPESALSAVLAETARILRPGGAARFLEFWPTGDLLRDATVYEHAERNNEPHFRTLFGADLGRLCCDAGLSVPSRMPFDERAAGLSPNGIGPRREWHFPWTVLAADRPGPAA